MHIHTHSHNLTFTFSNSPILYVFGLWGKKGKHMQTPHGKVSWHRICCDLKVTPTEPSNRKPNHAKPCLASEILVKFQAQIFLSKYSLFSTMIPQLFTDLITFNPSLLPSTLQTSMLETSRMLCLPLNHLLNLYTLTTGLKDTTCPISSNSSVTVGLNEFQAHDMIVGPCLGMDTT